MLLAVIKIVAMAWDNRKSVTRNVCKWPVGDLKVEL